MFKVAKIRRIKWPVLIQVPQDGGKVSEREVTVEFEDISRSEQNQIYEGGGNDATLLKRVVKGWGGGQFKDESDNDIEFSEQALAELIETVYVETAFVKAFLELHNGRAAVRKN